MHALDVLVLVPENAREVVLHHVILDVPVDVKDVLDHVSEDVPDDVMVDVPDAVLVVADAVLAVDALLLVRVHVLVAVPDVRVVVLRMDRE